MEHDRLRDAWLLAETTERTLLDIVAAIHLVVGGAARRVVLASLPEPELVAAEALAYAQAAGVEFQLARRPGVPTPCVIIGPRSRRAHTGYNEVS